MIYVIMSLRVVFGLSTLYFKKLVNQAFSKPSWKQSKNILPLAINNLNNSFVFPLCLEHLEINEELLEQNRQKTWLCVGCFVPVKHARILLDDDCSQVIFCSLSGYEELKRTSRLFTGCTLRGLLIQMQNISFRSSGMKCSHQDFALGSLRAPYVENQGPFKKIRGTKLLQMICQ